MSEKFRQDMPPPGGYRAFNWNRTYPKVFLKPGLVFVLNLGTCVYGFYYNLRDFPRRRLTMYFEDKDLMNALMPFLLAERDRHVLRIMNKNAEVEKELMKDVPGWKVGTWYGEPVYFTLGEHWIEPIPMEMNVHLRDKDWAKNSYWWQEGPWHMRKYVWI